MAILRAIEASRPAGERICHDPIARSMVSGVKLALSRLTIGLGLYGRFAPGVLEFVTARERYVDEFLASRLGEDVTQVVILGAGFDTRAYRLAGVERARVYEVDHPATQAAKLARLRRVVDPLPAHVTFVAVDFNRETLAERLLASGYDEGAATVFVWQGVTMYLEPAAVDATLAFVAGRSGASSAVIFDYLTTEFLHGPLVRRMRRWMRMLGEELLFAIDAGGIERFLARRGFGDVVDADAAELRRRYLTGANATRAMLEGVRIASARVRGSAGEPPREDGR